MPRFYSRRTYSRWSPRRYMRPARSSYQTKKIAAQVNKAIVAQAEKKMNAFELNATFSSIGTTWVEHSWLPPFGSTSAARVGNKIAITELSFQGVLVGGQANLALDDNRNWVRIVLGIWKNPSSTGLSTHTVLYTNSFPTSLQIDYQTQPTLTHKLFDRTFTLTSPGKDSTGYLPPQRFVTYTHHFRKPIVVTFDALSSIPDKQWFLSMVSDSSAVPSPGFVSGDLKFTWIDI